MLLCPDKNHPTVVTEAPGQTTTSKRKTATDREILLVKTRKIEGNSKESARQWRV